MATFKKILCPTDMSEPSYEALRIANDLAAKFSSELTLLHVVVPMPTPPDFADIGNAELLSYHAQLSEKMEPALNEVVKSKVVDDVNIKVMVTSGEAADEIVRVATEEEMDLIIIATHGRTGWRHVVFGSVAEKVMRLATCPLLTVRAPGDK